MTVRDLLPFGRTSVPVTRGVSPIRSFQDEVNRLFSDFFGETPWPSYWLRDMPESTFVINPAIDMSENERSYTVTAELPGIMPSDVQITAAEGYVTIKGEKKVEEKEEKKGYFRQECSYGSFQRVIAVPDSANLDKAEANFKNGVLTLSIPKKAGAQSKERKIEIKQAA